MRIMVLVVALWMSSPSSIVVGGDFLVMSVNSSAKRYDEGQVAIAYVSSIGADSSTAPEGSQLQADIFAAERADAVVTPLGTDPTGSAKSTAIGAMASRATCKAYASDPAADLTAAPSCFVTWKDTTFTDCSTLVKCNTPGAQLCNLVSADHTKLQRDLAGTMCGSDCQSPDRSLRIKCP